ncbi:MAG: aminomethyl-transferring glycine dehydrogenase subunit GcvPB [Anaerolineae bacterium]|nr:aminomethyl-transferring glycine dehydrogenase subunit GcvPB [Anaerolineae bacterium]
MSEKLIYELSRPGRCACFLPEPDVPRAEMPEEWLRRDRPLLPEVSEVDLVRHYVRLSQLNHAVDTGFYPLGSCTMKYNPKVNEEACRLPGFAQTHPLQPEDTVQGNLRLMYELQCYLQELSGFAAVSLQPAAGAQGELAGILIMRAYQLDRGEKARNRILIPDSAHGTNPASTTMSGLEVVQLKSDARGNVDLDDLRAHLDERVIGMMLTNPNTLGLFDEHLQELARLVHEAGGLLYGDGANLNALMGVARPAALGFDVMHFNLHKTFSTPHGGGGPGSGPVGVTEGLARFLPGPVVVRHLDREACTCSEGEAHEESCYRYGLHRPESSIGPLKAFYGNFSVMVRAYTYIRMLGASGLRQASLDAVLNANYLQARLKKVYPLPYDRPCMHEFVLEGRLPDAPGVRALDISKRLMDYGIHPPTNYFPLIVHEALMIEPTETESKESLDAFADAMLRIAEEARAQPELLHEAPHHTVVGRLDEVRAAREPRLRWVPPAT